MPNDATIEIPGPWMLLNDHAIVGAHGTRPVVLMGGRNGGLVTRDASGRLVPVTPDNPNVRVVLAAPEVIAALRVLLDQIDDAANHGWDNSHILRVLRDGCLAREALAKAEGRA